MSGLHSSDGGSRTSGWQRGTVELLVRQSVHRAHPDRAAHHADNTSMASLLCPPASLAHELYGTTRMLLAVLDRHQLAEVCMVSPR